MPSDITIRPVGPHDQAFLREMQYLAFFVPPGAAPFPGDIVDEAKHLKYYAEFGQRQGDVGVVAERSDGGPIGAAWARLHPADAPGYGYVDDATPELTIAVTPDERGGGVGTELLARLLAAAGRCSLSVDTRNPALSLYRRFGFETVSQPGEHELVMLRDPRR